MTENIDRKPAYYAIIPANVRYCKELELGARLLYGEITALCHREGYCWAGNPYFQELYGIDESTIVRWLRSLKKMGFIRTERQNIGFKVTRKIYLTAAEIKKSDTSSQKCLDRGEEDEESNIFYDTGKNDGIEAGKNACHNTTSSSDDKTIQDKTGEVGSGQVKPTEGKKKPSRRELFEDSDHHIDAEEVKILQVEAEDSATVLFDKHFISRADSWEIAIRYRAGEINKLNKQARRQSASIKDYTTWLVAALIGEYGHRLPCKSLTVIGGAP